MQSRQHQPGTAQRNGALLSTEYIAGVDSSCRPCTYRLAIVSSKFNNTLPTTVHAANICMWLKRSLQFDPAKEAFVGDDEANSLRSRAMREPYII